jgi:hypothetical protein
MSKGTRLQFRDKRVDDITSYADLGSLRTDAPDGPPIWLRLVRKGAVFTGFISGDGVNWIKDGEITIVGMPPSLEIGMAVTSHDNKDTAMAVFQSLRITALTDANFTHTEIGTIGSYTAGAPNRFIIQSAGRGVANNGEGIAFVHRNIPFIGDVELTARVAVLTSPGTETLRAGVLLRNGLDQGDRIAGFGVELSANNGQRPVHLRRSADDGNVTAQFPMVAAPDGGAADSAPPDTASDDAGDVDAGPKLRPALTPLFVKLVRVGNRFVGFTSPNGRNFEPQVDVTGLVIATNALAGVFVTSGSEAAAAEGTLENVTIVSPPVTALPLLPDAGPPEAGAPDGGADAGTGN